MAEQHVPAHSQDTAACRVHSMEIGTMDKASPAMPHNEGTCWRPSRPATQHKQCCSTIHHNCRTLLMPWPPSSDLRRRQVIAPFQSWLHSRHLAAQPIRQHYSQNSGHATEAQHSGNTTEAQHSFHTALGLRILLCATLASTPQPWRTASGASLMATNMPRTPDSPLGCMTSGCHVLIQADWVVVRQGLAIA